MAQMLTILNANGPLDGIAIIHKLFDVVDGSLRAMCNASQQTVADTSLICSFMEVWDARETNYVRKVG